TLFRSHQAGMPEPTIDALPVDLGRHSTTLLGLGLELGFEAGELGERRIRIGLLFALAPIESGRPRRPPILLARWAVGTIAAVLAIGPPPMAGRPVGPGGGGVGGLLGRHLRILGRRLGLSVFRRGRRLGSPRWSTALAMAFVRPPASLGASRPPDLDQRRFGGSRSWLRCAIRGRGCRNGLLRRAFGDCFSDWCFGGILLRRSRER